MPTKCPACAGTGEDFHEGDSCTDCGGTGDSSRPGLMAGKSVALAYLNQQIAEQMKALYEAFPINTHER